MSRVSKPDDTVLAGLVAEFKRDICKLDVSVAVQKHLTYGPCCLLSSDVYFELKREIADRFKLHPAEVLVVGSAKLGFSIAPKKRYLLFNDQSDIDVALVAPQLFEQVWAEVHDYWDGGAYWEQHKMFCHYLFQGWIRPDKLPPSSQFDRAAKWWEYFRELTSTSRYGPYKIRAGLYKSWRFLESYQRRCVEQCKQTELSI
jgi:hypothetical protein